MRGRVSAARRPSSVRRPRCISGGMSPGCEHREALKAAYPHDQRTEVPCGVICEENVRNLGLIDVALNKADTVALLDDKLYFIYEGGEAEPEVATEGDGQQPQTA